MLDYVAFGALEAWDGMPFYVIGSRAKWEKI